MTRAWSRDITVDERLIHVRCELCSVADAGWELRIYEDDAVITTERHAREADARASAEASRLALNRRLARLRRRRPWRGGE